MGKFKIYIALISLQIMTLNLNAQDPAAANEKFKQGNLIDALRSYERLVEKDPENGVYFYRAGLCVLFTEKDKSAAAGYMRIAAKLDVDPDAMYFLGLAYHYNLDFDDALISYRKYKASGKGTKQNVVDRQIEMVNNAKKIVESPVDVTFENVGDKINTEFPDYYPFVTPDESCMIYTSRKRSGVKEFDGYYPSNIYYSQVVNGEFSKAKKGTLMINSSYDDQAVGLSYNADKLYIYLDDIKNVGDIYEADIKEDFKFKKKVIMGENVNSRGFESSATISADGSTLFFASEREGGLGGKDIYMTRKLPNGDWALPQNLGSSINTPYDEDFPNLFYDGSTLYFSSKGHNSIGGYDYFKSNWDAENNTWSTPENLGYPLNTPGDNVCISFTEDKRHAYISAWRPDSEGFQDIYRVTFNDIDSRESIIKSIIVQEGSTEPILDAFVIITDNRTQIEVGNYTPNSKNGSFIITLEPGSYNIMVDAPGFLPKSEDIIVKGKSDFVQFMTKTFTVSP